MLIEEIKRRNSELWVVTVSNPDFKKLNSLVYTGYAARLRRNQYVMDSKALDVIVGGE